MDRKLVNQLKNGFQKQEPIDRIINIQFRKTIITGNIMNRKRDSNQNVITSKSVIQC